jgi:diaminopimelate epimerase
MSPAGIPFAKGHGTGNDFIVLPNLDGALEVTPQHVRALCDRRRGIGADGVLVVARTVQNSEVADQADIAPLFMDYRNSDGSAAQMCGNGMRVFAAYLLENDLIDREPLQIATRGGARRVAVGPDSTVRVDMGAPTFLDREDIRVAPAATPQDALPASGVLMPNPHAVVWVHDLSSAGDLRVAPTVTPAEAYPEGVNVEFVRRISAGHIQMRVFERGVGETLSCGTGAGAAAVATARAAGNERDGSRMRVEVPGGEVAVTWHADGSVELDGPAQIVARGTIDQRWWEMHG